MTQALIDPTASVQCLSSWKLIDNKYVPVYTVIPNSARVAEVAKESFPIASPLFWVTCSQMVVADEWYYNTSTYVITKVPDPTPRPTN
jgi:hypothetical protein